MKGIEAGLLQRVCIYADSDIYAYAVRFYVSCRSIMSSPAGALPLLILFLIYSCCSVVYPLF